MKFVKDTAVITPPAFHLMFINTSKETSRLIRLYGISVCHSVCQLMDYILFSDNKTQNQITLDAFTDVTLALMFPSNLLTTYQ